MASYNKVILMGHLTRDPELRTLPNSQTPVCDFALAVNRQWKDAGGQAREEVLFVDCSAFGKPAQAIGENLTKGRPIHVEGRLKLDRWEQQDGQRRSKIRVVVEQFRFVDRKPANTEKPGNGGSEGDGAKPPKRAGRGGKRRAPEPVPVAAGAKDDIPF